MLVSNQVMHVQWDDIL